MRIGFYSGSFDPITVGHTDVIERAGRIVDRLVIGIGANASKSPLFTIDERLTMIEREVRSLSHGPRDVAVIAFEGLAVTAARENGASIIFRGLRDSTDFNYEMQMAGMNGAMEPSIQTVFVAASPTVRHIAANLVRQIALMNGDVSAFVSRDVAALLRSKVAGRTA